MGIRGLSTFIQEHKRSLSKTITVGGDAIQGKQKTHLVVDAWSFIYELQRSNIPWVYGGENCELYQLITNVVTEWTRVGFHLSFVFDGPYHTLKFPTAIERLSKTNIKNALLFFRTSAESRADPNSLHAFRILPPLYFAATLQTLKDLKSSTGAVDIYFADEEADSFAVELAGKLGGYIAGNDSDYVVFSADSYLGYVPFHDMVWTFDDAEPELAVADDGFQSVHRSKGRKKPSYRRSGIIPPDGRTNLCLSMSVYKPSALAALLDVPVSLLPLVGAMVGNDFTPQQSTSMLFRRNSSPSERITTVASTINRILHASTGSRKKQKHQVEGVMDLIQKAINTLLLQTPLTLSSKEIEALVDQVVVSALQYALPKADVASEQGSLDKTICPLHDADICPLLPSFSRSATVEALNATNETPELLQRVDIRSLYLSAYRNGALSPTIVDCLHTGTYWHDIFLEHPDIASVSHITQSIREIGYAILDDALGLPDPSDPEPEVEEESHHSTTSDNSSDDELVDVVEDDESDAEDDPLAPLKGALKRIIGGEQDSDIDVASTLTASRPKVVIEYIRRGTRVSPERAEVKPLTEIPIEGDEVPIPLTSVDFRRVLFLKTLHSHYDAILNLPALQISAVVALRWVVSYIGSVTEEKNVKEHEDERWTKEEARAFLLSFAWDGEHDHIEELPPLVNRNIQLTAQVVEALQAVEHLSQILLLSTQFPSPSHLFSGRVFHHNLTHTTDQKDISPGLETAIDIGLETAFRESRQGKAKRRAEKKKRKQSTVSNTAVAKNEGRGGLFAVLQEGVEI